MLLAAFAAKDIASFPCAPTAFAAKDTAIAVVVGQVGGYDGELEMLAPVSALFMQHTWTIVQHDGPNHLELWLHGCRPTDFNCACSGCRASSQPGSVRLSTPGHPMSAHQPLQNAPKNAFSRIVFFIYFKERRAGRVA